MKYEEMNLGQRGIKVKEDSGKSTRDRLETENNGNLWYRISCIYCRISEEPVYIYKSEVQPLKSLN